MPSNNRMLVMRSLAIALGFALTATSSFVTATDSAMRTFPGPQRELPSSDSTFTIVWWEPDASKSGQGLLLKAAHTPKTWRVYSFARAVSVSWAPHGHLFAVTDRMDGDSARTLVHSVTTGRYMDVCADPQRQLGNQWTSARRRYCEHTGWTRRGELELRLWGDGAGAAFDTHVTVPVAPDSASFALDLYLRASIDETGQLRIVTKDGREIVPKKEPDQVGFDQVMVSTDGLSVGWVALYPNCCTSYPIPLKLMIYSSGTLRTFTGRGLPLWRWRFQAESRQVAFQQETVHGGLGIHYEVRDVATGSLVAEYDPPYDRDNKPVVERSLPKWVEELDAK